MTIWDEAKQSVRGTIRVLRFDPDALEDFDLSLAGYWRSFYAAVFLFPLLLLLLWVAPSPKGIDSSRQLLIEAINYPLSWLLWPLIAYYICRSAGLMDKYLAYITVYNWAQIPLSGIRTLLIILAFAMSGGAISAELVYLTLLLVLAAETVILRLVLGVQWGHAVMLESLILVLSLLLHFAKMIVMRGGA